MHSGLVQTPPPHLRPKLTPLALVPLGDLGLPGLILGVGRASLAPALGLPPDAARVVLARLLETVAGLLRLVQMFAEGVEGGLPGLVRRLALIRKGAVVPVGELLESL